jgi:hypothetical protein
MSDTQGHKSFEDMTDAEQAEFLSSATFCDQRANGQIHYRQHGTNHEAFEVAVGMFMAMEPEDRLEFQKAIAVYNTDPAAFLSTPAYAICVAEHGEDEKLCLRRPARPGKRSKKRG